MLLRSSGPGDGAAHRWGPSREAPAWGRRTVTDRTGELMARKLGVSDRAGAVSAAYQRGLLGR